MLAFALLLLAQVAPVQVGARPPECAPLEAGRASNAWERAKAPELVRYCDLLATGAARLAGGSAAQDVLLLADEADRAIPGRAAPTVLRARALERLGRYSDAAKAFERARTVDAHALDEPASLLSWARVLSRTGRGADALAAYRSLLPRASTLAVGERGPAYVEAGMLAMARGPTGLDDAVAIFRQGRRDSQDVAQTLDVVALALALDRAGEHAEARVELGDRPAAEVRAALADKGAADYAGPAGANELLAVRALVEEGEGSHNARQLWQSYLEQGGSKGPWADHARAHLLAMGRRRAPPDDLPGAASRAHAKDARSR